MLTQQKNTKIELWTEGNYSGSHCSNEADCDGGIIHTRQPCGENFDNSQQCNLTAEYS